MQAWPSQTRRCIFAENYNTKYNLNNLETTVQAFIFLKQQSITRHTWIFYCEHQVFVIRGSVQDVL